MQIYLNFYAKPKPNWPTVICFSDFLITLTTSESFKSEGVFVYKVFSLANPAVESKLSLQFCRQ